MFGKIRQAVGGVVSKIGEGFKKVGEWVAGKPARPAIVLQSERNRFFAPVRRVYEVAVLSVCGLMVVVGEWAAAAVDTGV